MVIRGDSRLLAIYISFLVPCFLTQGSFYTELLIETLLFPLESFDRIHKLKGAEAIKGTVVNSSTVSKGKNSC